jgi:hypothetical protein
MKVGDWVLADGERIGQITVLNSMGEGYHLVDFQDNTFARAVHQRRLTPINKEVADVFIKSNQKE